MKKAEFCLAKKIVNNPGLLIDEKTDCVSLTFGVAKLELHKDGRIVLANTESQFVLSPEGQVQIQGDSLATNLNLDIKLQAGRHIHLNSA